MTAPRPVPTPGQPPTQGQQPTPRRPPTTRQQPTPRRPPTTRQQPVARQGAPPPQPPSYEPSQPQEPSHQQGPPPPQQPPPLQPRPQQPPPLQPPQQPLPQMPAPPSSQPSQEGRPPEPRPSTQPPRLRRSEDDRVIAGVCGGIAAYLGSDATWVRIAWVIVTLVTSAVPMILIYILLAAILPAAPSARGAGDQEPVDALREPSASQDSGRHDWPIVFGILLLAVGGMLLIAQYVQLDWGVLWPVSLIALGIAVIVIAVRPRFGGRR